MTQFILIAAFAVVLFRRFEVSPRRLEAQFTNWVPRNARRIAVELWGFDVVAMLIRFAASESRCFELPGIQHYTSRQHTKRDVRAVKPMMRDWRFWNVHAACSMHEGRGCQGQARPADLHRRRHWSSC